MKQNINNILYIVVLLFIILLICLKAVDLHKNIMNTTEVSPANILEKFEEEGEKKMLGALSKVYNVNEGFLCLIGQQFCRKVIICSTVAGLLFIT